MAKKSIYEIFTKEKGEYKDYYVKATNSTEAKRMFAEKNNNKIYSIMKVPQKAQKYHRDELYIK